MTGDATVLVEDLGKGIRLITLNRPQAHNAIDMAMAQQLMALLDRAEADPALRCLVLAGAGGKAFSAGFDVHEMAGFDGAAMRDAFVRRDPLMLRIALHRLPVIAALTGLTYGAGALIAAACDLRVAGQGTRFKVTAINYGSANATWSLPPLVGAGRAKDLLLAGRVVEGEEGYRIGLFDRLVPDAEVLECALSLALEIAAKPPAGVVAAKSLVNASQAEGIAAGWQAEHDHILSAFDNEAQSGSAIFEGFLGGTNRTRSD